ncbi:MAG: glucose-1-phosphate adenylyltransferase [Clostridiales bacterium]|jgi:glucose-1-phosphate adenylyltransferase|nr:glucose-1-phosphate adenylyltransferase [Clostridiales bacterium]
MARREIIAMLLAGGQGSRLGILSKKKAKPAISFGGKYRIIDFPLSNCVNSEIDTVGILTQYQPFVLNKHIGIGIPWDLDRPNSGAVILPPHLKSSEGDWYSGTANAIYQNINFINSYSPRYVLIISGDHVYKMDYSKMLEYHRRKNADATIAVLEININDASRFGIMNVDENNKIYKFEEKPEFPKSNLASMGIYIFDWSKLHEFLILDNKIHNNSDFGAHIIPEMIKFKKNVYAYKFVDYWKDVGTIESYWLANMELIKTLPSFNLYENFWKIYTQVEYQSPHYFGKNSDVSTCIISEGCEIYGKIYNSILGYNVVVEENAIIKDSIIMSNSIVKKNCYIEKSIVDENCIIDKNCKIGIGKNIINSSEPNIYNSGISIIGENSFILEGLNIGKNCVVSGELKKENIINNELESGENLIINNMI